MNATEGRAGYRRRVWAWIRRNGGLLCLLAGIAVLAYPVAATMWNNHAYNDAANRQLAHVSRVSRADRDEAITRAQAYNEEPARGPILDPWVEHYVPDTKEWKEYASQLDFGEGENAAWGTVVIPKIHVNLPIYRGTSDAVLAKGVGHLFGSSLPVGGASTHAVLTAHSGLGTATMFDDLPRLAAGDAFYLNVAGRHMKYVVESTEVVEPTEVDNLRVRAGEDRVTLVTCTPYGVNTHRLFVHGVRAPLEQDDRADVNTVTPLWHNWMLWPLLVIAAGAGVGAYVAWRRRR